MVTISIYTQGKKIKGLSLAALGVFSCYCSIYKQEQCCLHCSTSLSMCTMRILLLNIIIFLFYNNNNNIFSAKNTQNPILYWWWWWRPLSCHSIFLQIYKTWLPYFTTIYVYFKQKRVKTLFAYLTLNCSAYYPHLHISFIHIEEELLLLDRASLECSSTLHNHSTVMADDSSNDRHLSPKLVETVFLNPFSNCAAHQL